jgi:glucokinase
VTGRWAIGVDVGGSKIASAVVSEDGLVEGRRVVATPVGQGAAAVLAAITRQVRDALGLLPRGDLLAGLGISTGGAVDHASGIVLSATDLLPGWAGRELAADLRHQLGVAVYVDNDGNAHALGEHRFGAGRGLRDMLCVAVGTGIGGGLVLDGRIRRGASHTAGEIGHVPAVGAQERTCSCGGVGHVETVASGPAMTARYRDLSGDPDVTDLRVVARRADEGDPIATAVLADGGGSLGQVLAGLVNTLDPQAVVLAGGVADVGEKFCVPLRDSLQTSALPGPSRVAVLPAQLGGAAPLAGAGLLALERHGEDRRIEGVDQWQ